MAKMLAESHVGHNACGRRVKCCRTHEFVTHHGRQVGKVRKVQRAREKRLWKRFERAEN